MECRDRVDYGRIEQVSKLLDEDDRDISSMKLVFRRSRHRLLKDEVKNKEMETDFGERYFWEDLKCCYYCHSERL